MVLDNHFQFFFAKVWTTTFVGIHVVTKETYKPSLHVCLKELHVFRITQYSWIRAGLAMQGNLSLKHGLQRFLESRATLTNGLNLFHCP